MNRGTDVNFFKKLKYKVDELKGRIRETTGTSTGNTRLVDEGLHEQAQANAKQVDEPGDTDPNDPPGPKDAGER